jgi:membrane-associated phospholipid phosphatase
MRSIFRTLLPVDILFITFIGYLSFVGVLTIHNPNTLALFLVLNVTFSAGVVVLAKKADSAKILRLIHDWYPAPSIYLIYKQVHVIIQSMGVKDWDWFLIEVDRFLFGVDPTAWLSRWINPVLTEIMQFAYASYFLIMLALGVELYLKKEYEKYYFGVFAIVFGFILSYFGYMLFPAVGPRFTLHDFDMLKNELPGIWLANGIRDILNVGESIPRNAVNAIALAQRDVFPSGHTQLTIVTIILAFRYKMKCRYVVTFLGILLIISAVYLRYHYVIDIIGGIIFVWPTLWLAPIFINWWNKKRSS